jgi:transcriptional regulator with XRE-family HTH domain
MSSIGKRVAELRERRGLSAAELARRIEIKQPSIWAIENGTTKSLRGNTLTRLCEELRTTADYLLRGMAGPGGLELAVMEAELTFTIRALSAEKRIALIEYARFLMGQQRPAAPPINGDARISPIRPHKPKQ